MTISQFKGRLPCRITERNFGRGESKNAMKARWSCSFLLTYRRRRLSFNNAIKCCGSTGDQHTSDHISLSSSSIRKRSDSNDASVVTDGILDSTRTPLTSQSSLQSVQTELIMLALPAIVGQAIEPLAQLMETAFIGRLELLEDLHPYLFNCAYQLASAAVSITIFNIISKVFNIPLLSVATSFVAEDISKTRKEFASDESAERQFLPSVSTALLLALAIGIFEASAMYMGSAVFVNIMGLSSASPMYIPAQKFLSVRAIGAPAVVVSLAIQGIFRGLGNLSAIFLFPILMYSYGLGVTGAAISTVLSQYIVAILMIWHLNKRTVLLLPGIKNLQFGGYLKSGGFLLGRTLVSVMTITLSTSMAARLGPLALAAHQICLQVWLSVSLLFDAQAASGQALIASSLAKGDYARVKEITYCTLKTGLFTGISLAVILGASFGSLATLFTRDKEVLRIIRSVLLLVSSSLPITALAYTFDGLHYGISDFSYAAFSMMVVGAVSSAFLLFASSVMGLSGVWTGLALFMGLRTGAGLLR
ncbi:Multi antimicrobial extrusion protein - like 2 [Theobroma cacao]|nr:Multi antimicrobial extrusion protein - like 2 [Theobroma cacao]